MELSVQKVLRQAFAQQNEGKLQEAERLYRAVLDSVPEHPEANHNLGILTLSLNQIKTAVILLKTAVESDPTNEQYWVSYIVALIKDDQREVAKENILKAKKRGFKDKRFDDLDLAIPSDKSPSIIETDNLIKSYQSGNYEDTLNLAFSIVKKFPNHFMTWKMLGLVFGQIGEFDRALTSNQKAVLIDPEEPYVNSNLGLTLAKLNRPEEAEQFIRKAIELKPDEPVFYFNLGVTLQALSEFKKAEESLRKAIEIKPNYTEAHHELGTVLIVLGEVKEASIFFDKARELEGALKK